MYLLRFKYISEFLLTGGGVMTHKIYEIDENASVIVLDIEPENIDDYLMENIVSICEGNSGTDLEITKIRLRDYLKKKELNQRIGAIAEFYIHLFLKFLGYKQNFLFLNLEENSIKKGFDGYFSFNGEEWIVESKSGIDVTHKAKVSEAYRDLKKKITTKEKNNPWHNAYNHASLIDVGADKTVINKLKLLSNSYFKGIFFPITNYNLMPCGTVFNHNATDEEIKDTVFNDVKTILKNMDYKNVCLIAISNRAYDTFLKFIELEE